MRRGNSPRTWLKRIVALVLGIVLCPVGCVGEPNRKVDLPTIIDPPTPSSVIRWFNSNILPAAYGVEIGFQLGFADDRLTVGVDLYNNGNLPIAYRYYSPSEPMLCKRATVDGGILNIFFEPYMWAEVNGVRLPPPLLEVVQPGDTSQWQGSLSVEDSCLDVRLMSVHRPARWRACWGVVELSSDYALGGSLGTPTGGSITAEDRIPVLLCSPSADLPAEWYAG